MPKVSAKTAKIGRAGREAPVLGEVAAPFVAALLFVLFVAALLEVLLPGVLLAAVFTFCPG